MLKNPLQSIRITSHFEEDPVLKQSETPKLKLIARGSVSGGTREHDSMTPLCGQLSCGLSHVQCWTRSRICTHKQWPSFAEGPKLMQIYRKQVQTPQTMCFLSWSAISGVTGKNERCDQEKYFIFWIFLYEGALSCCLVSNVQPAQVFRKIFNSSSNDSQGSCSNSWVCNAKLKRWFHRSTLSMHCQRYSVFGQLYKDT